MSLICIHLCYPNTIKIPSAAVVVVVHKEKRNMRYLTKHSTHFIHGYMALEARGHIYQILKF